MNTIIHPEPSPAHRAMMRASADAFRQPSYDCQEHRGTMKLMIYVPGVESSGVDIEARGGDLTVTARKPHVVRVNFNALHLEHVQQDYQLRLRLGSGYDYGAMHAEMSQGLLTVTLPKRTPEAASRLRHVA
ncbi:MAG: Hsp20/alpha crystallin family protein [Opitutus sp.]